MRTFLIHHHTLSILTTTLKVILHIMIFVTLNDMYSFFQHVFLDIDEKCTSFNKKLVNITFYERKLWLNSLCCCTSCTDRCSNLIAKLNVITSFSYCVKIYFSLTIIAVFMKYYATIHIQLLLMQVNV